MSIILKSERLKKILTLTDENGVVSVKDISKVLTVSSMTIRRDLEELASQNQIIRIHGGAQSINYQVGARELSHNQKRDLNRNEKNHIARIVASMVNTNETVFIGPGTTNELIAKYLTFTNVRIVTNSLPVFQSFQTTIKGIDISLVGGHYREYSGAFIGSLATNTIEQLHFQKAFISLNGVHDNKITNANPDEGMMNKLALDRSDQKYAVADYTKFDQEDFYHFYATDKLNGIVTDDEISPNTKTKYSKYTRIIN